MVKNQDIQDRLRAEIDAAYDEADSNGPDYTVIQVGKINETLHNILMIYVLLKNLPYLDMVLHETLRLHPPAGKISIIVFRCLTNSLVNIPSGTLSRVCVKDYKLDDRLTLTRGMAVS